MLHFPIITTILALISSSSSSSCISDCSSYSCLPELDASSCPPDTVLESGLIGGCCPACIKYLDLGDRCHEPDVATFHTITKPIPCNDGVYTSAIFHEVNKDEFVPLINKYACPTGTYCNETTLVCEVHDNDEKYGCHNYLDDYYEWLEIEDPEVKCKSMDWERSCSSNGLFDGEQTRSSPFYMGHSFCVDPFGNPIFGKWIDNIYDINANVNATCGCSRKMWELTNLLKIDSTFGWELPATLHCTPKGAFEPMQCEQNSCWCADPTTGKPISTVLDQGLRNLLPCYDVNLHHNYLRRCENRAMGKAKTRAILSRHGLRWEESRAEIHCEWDGGFGPKLCLDSECRCVDKNGNLISNYFVTMQESQNLNCACARDTVEQRALGLDCVSGTGEYRATQRLRSVEFCVDVDSGFRTTGLYRLPGDGRRCRIHGCQESDEVCDADGNCDEDCSVECG